MSFSYDILKEEMLSYFCPPHVSEYNNTMDLEEHFGHFENLTLNTSTQKRSNAKHSLSPWSGPCNSGSTPYCSHLFSCLKTLLHYSHATSRAPNSINMFNLKQKPQEFLQKYIHRFIQVALEIPSVVVEILTGAFVQGFARWTSFAH